ncbi:MAG: hypothetical protein GY820_33175 [Gammaproteobacteria bacterium]|nr:hypothetical protein [Gammaproteobacteria bacterium]
MMLRKRAYSYEVFRLQNNNNDKQPKHHTRHATLYTIWRRLVKDPGSHSWRNDIINKMGTTHGHGNVNWEGKSKRHGLHRRIAIEIPGE